MPVTAPLAGLAGRGNLCGVVLLGLVNLQQRGQRIATYPLAKQKRPVKKLRYFVWSNVVGVLVPILNRVALSPTLPRYAIAMRFLGSIRLAVIHHISIYSDKPMPEMPPLSEAAPSVVQSLLIRGLRE